MSKITASLPLATWRPILAIAAVVVPLGAQTRVATHYFYWYRWPAEHFPAGRPKAEGHLHHFPVPRAVSYLDPDWHEAQFRDMAGCGIDFALPVYWGAPGAYDLPDLRFSRAGLPAMVKALERLAARKASTVRLGLFYDTSTLWNAIRRVPPRNRKPDLTKPAGRELFCRTIIEFFEQIPNRFWARVDDAALVVLYVSSFASKWDESLGSAVRRAFAARFPGERIFLVADASWGRIGQDRTTAWGAALQGPRIFDDVAQIGPGYDDSPVPGRRTPVRDREDGNFYGWAWRRAIAATPKLVLIETWNEMHEGTEICRTRETGSRYLDLTRTWIDRLRRGDLGPAVRLARADPRPRPDKSWGEEAHGADMVRVDYTGDVPDRFGLREVAWEDGGLEIEDGRLRPRGGGAVTYLYFQVSDHWCFDQDRRLELTLWTDPSPGAVRPLRLEYDSMDATAILRGSYTAAVCSRSERVGAATKSIYSLVRARLANRQNAGADFRLSIRGGDVRVRRIELRQKRGS